MAGSAKPLRQKSELSGLAGPVDAFDHEQFSLGIRAVL